MSTTQTKPAVKSRLKAKPPEETKPGKTKALIFGASGVGKTWFTLRFPTPYYIDTEGGADGDHYQAILRQAGGSYMGPSEGALDFDTVIEQMQALATEEHGYKTLIIDSITKLYQTAIANEAEKLGDKDAFGASKKPAIAAMRRVVNWAMRLDLNIWFVAHETAEWGVSPKTGQREEIGKLPDVWDKLIYELDLALHAFKAGPSRMARVKKSRLIGFPDLDTFELDYSAFAQRYGQEAIEAGTSKLILATPEQLAEINRLLGVLNVPGAEVEKVLTRASADNWTELTTEQADATVAWLKKKLV